jgi:hypothetical protein
VFLYISPRGGLAHGCKTASTNLEAFTEAPYGMRLNSPIVVAYEDRSSAIPGVELLARSLQRHSPDLNLHIYSPLDAAAERLTGLRTVTFIRTTDLVNRGWNAKPSILLRALKEHERVLWLDTDVIISGDIGSLIDRFDKDAVVVGQEFRGKSGDGGYIRAKAYGLAPSRPLPHTVNSGSIIVSRKHRSLIEAWSALLSNLDYQAAQSQPIRERAPAFVGDQDSLWALLASQGFTDVKVDYFRVGSDMIQHSGANGYHVIDRLIRPFGNGPVFVHMLGRYKPWSFGTIPSARRNLTDYLHMVCFELSPYFETAQPYAAQLGSPCWLRRRTLPAKFFNLMFGGNVALRGMPLAIASWIAALSGRRPKL